MDNNPTHAKKKRNKNRRKQVESQPTSDVSTSALNLWNEVFSFEIGLLLRILVGRKKEA
jgi:hypothetical protein